MGGKSQTIGYRYFMSLLSGLCRGPVNEFVEIEAGEKKAWTGAITENGYDYIDKAELFGGKKKEGGLRGPFYVGMGGADQVYPGDGPKVADTYLPDVKGRINEPGLVSEFRGVVTVWYDGLVSAMSPYVKEWRFRVRRWNAGWWQDNPWYPEKALILLEDGRVKAMNAAHIIYECCTNPVWGRGLPASELDENSFIYAANRLCNEKFGLCIAWYRKEDIDVFIKKICDLVGGVVYTDRETGLVVFRLIRDDYELNDLPLFTPSSGLIDVQEDNSASAQTAYNEIIGTSTSPITNLDIQVRAQNLAAFQAQQAVSSLDQDYKGIPTKQLLSRVVLRDLRAGSAGLKKYTVAFDRRAWRIAPGMPFRISDPSKGIENVVLRAGEIDDGDMVNGRITIKAAVDVFGLPESSYFTPVDNTWTPPGSEALPAPLHRLVESSYRDVYRAIGSQAGTESAYVEQLAVSPSPSSYEYELATKVDGEDYEVRETGSFTGAIRLAAKVTPLETSWTVTAPVDFGANNIGQALLVDDELVRLDAYDEITSVITVSRGAGDTLPVAHDVNAVIWTIDEDAVSDNRVYVEGETVSSKVLTRTSSDVLSLEDATEDQVEIVNRQFRPYPPGNVKIDGASIYAPEISPEPVLTWSHRDRLLQADMLLGHTEGSVGPEEGVTYNLRVFRAGVVVREVNLGTVDTWTYTVAMQVADDVQSSVTMELESVRDSVTSQFYYRFSVPLSMEAYLMIDGDVVLVDGERIIM